MEGYQAYTIATLICDEGYYLYYSLRNTKNYLKCKLGGYWPKQETCSLPPPTTTAAPSGHITHQSFYIIAIDFWKSSTNRM